MIEAESHWVPPSRRGEGARRYSDFGAAGPAAAPGSALPMHHAAQRCSTGLRSP